MSETKPIPLAQEQSTSTPKANSLPRDKTLLRRVSSSPVFASNASSFGAELRRRSDSLFHSSEQLPLIMDETDSGRRSNASTISSDGEEKSTSTTTSPDQAGIDEWLLWRKNRRNSSPVVITNSSVGTSV